MGFRRRVERGEAAALDEGQMHARPDRVDRSLDRPLAFEEGYDRIRGAGPTVLSRGQLDADA